jgi:hypothetical protein
MVELPGPTGTTGADPGTAGTAKPKASEKDGPAESGENPAPGVASGTAIVDTAIANTTTEEDVAYETMASKKKVAKCEENPGTADRGGGTGFGRGGEGGGKAPARGGTAATGRRRRRWSWDGTVRQEDDSGVVLNAISAMASALARGVFLPFLK